MTNKRLYLFVGYPGAGKTTVSRLIAEMTGAVHIWADEERQRMFLNPTHSPQESKRLYAYLNEKVAHLLAAGNSVIFDTNFNFKKDRDHLRSIAEANGAEAVIIWITTPIELAKQRATQESHNVDTRIWGNMSEEAFERISSHLQPPSVSEHPVAFDGTTIDPAEVARKLGLNE